MKPAKAKRVRAVVGNSPVRALETELRELRRELRTTIHAYQAGLEVQLAESLAMLENAGAIEELPRERIHAFRDLTTMVRKRKVKPEKGRRKDLRKIDSLISDVRLFLPNQP